MIVVRDVWLLCYCFYRTLQYFQESLSSKLSVVFDKLLLLQKSPAHDFIVCWICYPAKAYLNSCTAEIIVDTCDWHQPIDQNHRVLIPLLLKLVFYRGKNNLLSQTV